ncbi:unnamed protein product [Prorocentrum cordatum]|uniref:Transmembrane protein n=1 Tax=Prorocentrum cordatum TaxID=2364126 RepID=A0ABN9PLK9_9DINO|nr:unnamed protein product [Polarella glacialis]
MWVEEAWIRVDNLEAVDWAIEPPKALDGHLLSGLLSVVSVVGMVLGAARISISFGLVTGRRFCVLFALLCFGLMVPAAVWPCRNVLYLAMGLVVIRRVVLLVGCAVLPLIGCIVIVSLKLMLLRCGGALHYSSVQALFAVVASIYVLLLVPGCVDSPCLVDGAVVIAALGCWRRCSGVLRACDLAMGVLEAEANLLRNERRRRRRKRLG